MKVGGGQYHLTRAVPMSKQEEARDRVLDLIESLEVGQAIPSERQLTQELGVSRLTVRAALDELVEELFAVADEIDTARTG